MEDITELFVKFFEIATIILFIIIILAIIWRLVLKGDNYGIWFLYIDSIFSICRFNTYFWLLKGGLDVEIIMAFVYSVGYFILGFLFGQLVCFTLDCLLKLIRKFVNKR